jgi:tRNA threonylcarbamoyladenosine biosynthesis protein TsaE
MPPTAVWAMETASESETEDAGFRTGRVALELSGPGRGLPILLSGPLGAGKTCFVRGVARGLGSGSVPRSPTFALHVFHPGGRGLHHLDLYRLSGPRALDELGLDELFAGDDVVAVEWAERLGKDEPEVALKVDLEPLPGGRRRIRFTGPPEWLSRIEAVANEGRSRARSGN